MQKPFENRRLYDPESKQTVHLLDKTSEGSQPPVEVSAYDDDPGIEAMLEQYNFSYILSKVKRMDNFLAKIVHSDVLDLELEDIAEEVYIHFWQKLQKEAIQNPEAYIASMVRNRCIDATRRRTQRTISQLLSRIDNEEVLEHKYMLEPGETMVDPADEFEQRSAIAKRTDEVASAVAALPPRQRLAMMCSLLERVDNLILLEKALSAHGLDVGVQWPEDKDAERLLKASLLAARLSLAKQLNVDLSVYGRPKCQPLPVRGAPVTTQP